MKALLITSCTKRKVFDHQIDSSESLEKLSAEDFFLDNQVKKHKLAKAGFECEAFDMYTGPQYGKRDGKLGPIREAVRILRNQGVEFDHYILSAGYGLIKSNEKILPYDVSFQYSNRYFGQQTNGKYNSFLEWGSFLKVRADLDNLIKDYDLIVFLLAMQYTEVLNLNINPLNLSGKQKVLYIDSPESLQHPSKKFLILNPANYDCNKLRCNNLQKRGSLFLQMVYSMNSNGSVFDYIYKNDQKTITLDLSRFEVLNNKTPSSSSLSYKVNKQTKDKTLNKRSTQKAIVYDVICSVPGLSDEEIVYELQKKGYSSIIHQAVNQYARALEKDGMVTRKKTDKWIRNYPSDGLQN